MGWHLGTSARKTNPAAQKMPNAWGLYDMHGNVWEWCEDWEGKYPAGFVEDPKGPSKGSSRVCRGGSFKYTDYLCRSAFRHSISPDYQWFDLGFRVVCSPVHYQPLQ